MHFTTNG